MTGVLEVLNAAVAEGQTPGAAALVRTADGERHVFCVGALHQHARAPLVDANTVYDLASLTKLLCTTVLCARLLDAHRLTLDETPWPHWPGVTVAHVLQHNAGLVAWQDLHTHVPAVAFGSAAAVDGVLQRIAAIPALSPPGVTTRYSDLGFIALGALLEQRFGQPLDDVVHAISPLRFVCLRSDGFHPLVPHVAPTEFCPWRKRVVVGQVHDENAYALGGVSGHAGLFGSLLDVEEAAWDLVDAVKRDTTLSRMANASGDRGLGFDRVTPGGSTGDALSPQTVGHLGFTGTSLWIDPALRGGALFVLLTNHVHFGRNAERIRTLRQRFHRAAAAML